MAIRLQTFFRTARTRYGLRLLAGRSGLAHEFSWVHLLEDIGNADFLRGGELVITTGLAALQEHWLRDFVHALARRQAAALILNTGKYLREGDITDEVRALCDAAALPLFLMPWRTHISDLMQDVCAQLMEQAQTERRTEQLLTALLDDAPPGGAPAGDTLLPLYPSASGRPILLTGHQLAALSELTERGFHPARFSLSVFDLGTPIAPTEEADLCRSFRRRLAALEAPFWLFLRQGRLLLLRELPAGGRPREHPEEQDALAALLEEECATSQPASTLQGGESDPHTELAALPTAYREALAALTAARTGLLEVETADAGDSERADAPPHTTEAIAEAPPRLLSFAALGTYRLLFTHPDRTLLHAFAEEQLGALLRYDARHHAHLAETLRCYLLTGGSLARTAAHTYTHRNTAGYRLRKVRALLGTDLKTPAARFPLLLAFTILRFETCLTAEGATKP